MHSITALYTVSQKNCSTLFVSNYSGVVMGGPTGQPPRAALFKGRQIESVVKKLCCVREIK